ncbi:ABC transporter substrate-binding protein [Actinomadura macra]|uniref:ABC transporter substrate-binding protein n=1 Tax=Actinomadura macra TaxID=46164 RepID=UPI00082CDD41|nr:ABC transporter substrate-binding protein [Actinomadura macra]
MRFKRWVAAAMVATMGLAASGCGGSDGGSNGGSGLEKTDIKIGVLPLADYAAVYWADQKGFFKKEGLNVTLQPIQGGPVGVQKVVSNELEVSFSNSISSSIASDKGAPIKTIAITSSLGPGTNTIFVKPDSPIKDINGLDGKTIGVNTVNNIGDVTFKNLATSMGLNVKPKWVEVPFPEMINGVKSGSIQAGYLPEPFATAARKERLRPVVDLTNGPNRALPAATFVISTMFAKTSPRTTEAVQRAINAASKDMSSKEAEFRAWIPSVSNTSKEAAEVMRLPIFESENSVEKLQRVADTLIRLGLVKKGYRASEYTFVPGKG